MTVAHTSCDSGDFFTTRFQQLTGHTPFPWQDELYQLFLQGIIPRSCTLPTGLGKTSVITTWFIARERGAPIPRRLVYVINRRTVVDQTTTEVETLRSKLAEPESLAISTLRGQHADNRQWSTDPSRQAVIIGTVDMIGSRLLFSGYGLGFRSRPLHAGFLGQDALIVHDESHLEPAFQQLIETIRQHQEKDKEFGRFHVMQMSATARTANDKSPSCDIALSERDRSHAVIRQRINAHKQLTLTEVGKDNDIPEKIKDICARYADEHTAILIFLRTLDDVDKVTKALPKGRVIQLTGVMRGKERDELVDKPEFRRFLGEGSGETVYLVCTSAGEVGVDLSADHMVCDLSTLESMVQRFGRVNRYGKRKDTRIDVVHPRPEALNDKLAEQRKATLELLQSLDGDASPGALLALGQRSDAPRRIEEGFSPAPKILPVTDILLDAWSLTTIRTPMPGRPPVEPYLHGVADWELPQTHVAWREEVEVITGVRLEQHRPADLLDDFPLKPHEVLRDRSDRVIKALAKIANTQESKPAWFVDAQGQVHVTTIGDLAGNRWKDRIHNGTVLLPPSAGGLKEGMLDGASAEVDDVANILTPPEARRRIWQDGSAVEATPAGMRRIRSIVFESETDADEVRRWDWYESLPLQGGSASSRAVGLDTHTDDVVAHAGRILDRLTLPEEIVQAILLAAGRHDRGKNSPSFQSTLGNYNYPRLVLAKSNRLGSGSGGPFRHELASLAAASQDADLLRLSPEARELALHLIAAHHGRARPHFYHEEAFLPDRPQSEVESLVAEVPRRFARLQRRYGRWGLAYLESLLRAADWAASAAPSAFIDPQEVAK